MHTRHWKIDVFLSEEEGNTHARAVLHADGPQPITGSGFARRNPHDPLVPEIGDELAAARALRHLADTLLQVTSEDITVSVGDDVRLR